ncbi:MAG: sensor domain-containing diguanylate cyclase [Leptolyngbya sp.]|nr:sensor domain-containing diguanylate cyclase [Leptolyngbya sp.]
MGPATELFPDFNAAATAVLSYLQQTLGFGLWMVTRTEGEDWIVLQAQDQGYGVKQGDVFRWTDSFCSRMVAGQGPRIAPNSEQVPAYAAAPIAAQVAIRAYVGVPLAAQDGTLFGTLCAIDPTPQPESITEHLPLIELLAQLLSSILHADMAAAEQARRADRLQTEAFTDALTGLYNRRGWDQLLAEEEESCANYGFPACVVVIDLDNLKTVNDTLGHTAGDLLIQQTSEILRQETRRHDIIARIGGDEFVVLCTECSAGQGQWLGERLQQALNNNDIQASVGIAPRYPSRGLKAAWAEADRAMYQQKRHHQTASCSPR